MQFWKSQILNETNFCLLKKTNTEYSLKKKTPVCMDYFQTDVTYINSNPSYFSFE